MVTVREISIAKVKIKRDSADEPSGNKKRSTFVTFGLIHIISQSPKGRGNERKKKERKRRIERKEKERRGREVQGVQEMKKKTRSGRLSTACTRMKNRKKKQRRSEKPWLKGISETQYTLRISRRICSRSTSRRAGKGTWSLPATPYLLDSS